MWDVDKIVPAQTVYMTHDPIARATGGQGLVQTEKKQNLIEMN